MPRLNTDGGQQCKLLFSAGLWPSPNHSEPDGCRLQDILPQLKHRRRHQCTGSFPPVLWPRPLQSESDYSRVYTYHARITHRRRANKANLNNTRPQSGPKPESLRSPTVVVSGHPYQHIEHTGLKSTTEGNKGVRLSPATRISQ